MVGLTSLLSLSLSLLFLVWWCHLMSFLALLIASLIDGWVSTCVLRCWPVFGRMLWPSLASLELDLRLAWVRSDWTDEGKWSVKRIRMKDGDDDAGWAREHGCWWPSMRGAGPQDLFQFQLRWLLLFVMEARVQCHGVPLRWLVCVVLHGNCKEWQAVWLKEAGNWWECDTTVVCK